MTKVLGKNLAVGMGKESTPQTGVSPTVWLPLLSKTLNPKVELAYDMSDWGHNISSSDSSVVMKYAEPTLRGYVFDNSFGIILQAIGFQFTNTGSNPYTHTGAFAETFARNTYSLVAKDANETLGFFGAVMNDLEMTFRPREYCSWSANFKSLFYATDSETVAWDTDENKFNGTHATVKIASTVAGLSGATALTLDGASLKIDNKLMQHESLGSSNPKGFYAQQVDITGSIDILVSDNTVRDLFAAGTKKAIEIFLEDTAIDLGGGVHPSLTITLDLATFSGMNEESNNESLRKRTFDFTSHYDLTNGSAISCELINSKASY